MASKAREGSSVSPARPPRMVEGVLASVLESECRKLLPSPQGPQLSWTLLVGLLALAFLLGCCAGALLLGLLGFSAWRWWTGGRWPAVTAVEATLAPAADGPNRLEGYRRR